MLRLAEFWMEAVHKIMSTRIQLRRDTDTNWASVNPVLYSGEAGFEMNTGKLKIGDGATDWVHLPYISGSANNYSQSFADVYRTISSSFATASNAVLQSQWSSSNFLNMSSSLLVGKISEASNILTQSIHDFSGSFVLTNNNVSQTVLNTSASVYNLSLAYTAASTSLASTLSTLGSSYYASSQSFAGSISTFAGTYTTGNIVQTWITQSQTATLTSSSLVAQGKIDSAVAAFATTSSVQTWITQSQTSTLASASQVSAAQISTAASSYASATTVNATYSNAISANINTQITNSLALGGYMSSSISASVSTVAKAVADLNTGVGAIYSLQVSAGKITGFTLFSDKSNSTFAVRADTFYISDAAGASTGLAPFIVTGGVVYINTASIQNLTVAQLTAGTIKYGIALGNAGVINYGKTSYSDNTSGFWLAGPSGIGDSTPAQFAIGNSTNYLKWDGTNLSIAGSITITNTIPYSSVSGTPSLATVATTGQYGDIVGTKPPSNADVTNTALNTGTTITGGGITLSSGGAIKGGASDFLTGTGFFLGYTSTGTNGTNYKFSVGNSTNYIAWDGANWVVHLPAPTSVNPPAESHAGSTCHLNLPGGAPAGYTINYQIVYVNGSAGPIVQSTNNTTFSITGTMSEVSYWGSCAGYEDSYISVDGFI